MGRSNTQFLLRLTVATVFGFALAGCGQHSGSKVAPKNIGQSFKVVSPSESQILGVDSHYNISIDRSSLGKEFLLQGELIQETPVAWGNSIKSRIVTFIERDNKLYMLESNDGNSVTGDLPQNLLLASFPVIQSDSNQIVFDFNAGMSRLFVASDMYGADLNGSKYNANQEFQSVNLDDSYIDSARIDDTNTTHRLIIRQIAQVSASGASNLPTDDNNDSNDVSIPIEVRYYLSPYRPDPNYKPFENDDFIHYGYFQVAPQITDEGDSVQYAERWDPAKLPITYAISANTPPEFVQAVKDGALYWNRVLGRTIVQVVMAPKGVTAPNPDYNIIQWVPYTTGSFSYADVQADPRTGEILHAQVFITSGFASTADNSARELLRRYETQSKSKKVPRTVSLTGFFKTPLCDYDSAAGMRDALTSLVNNAVSPSILEEAMQNEIRLVAAHEVGHTLGLRHNFAGSLAANYTMATRAQDIKAFLKTGTLPKNVVVSSSVMDYTLPDDNFILGGQLKDGAVLTYDSAAIRFLYAGVSPDKWPLFCTDSDVSKYYDCQRFDAGPSEVQFNSYENQDILKNLPNIVIEFYTAAETPFKNQLVTPLKDFVLPDPNSVVAELLAPRLALMQQFTKAVGVVSIQRKFAAVGAFDSNQIQSQEWTYLLKSIQHNGGFENFFSFLPSNFVSAEMKQLDTLLHQKAYLSGVENGQDFSFSSDDVKTIEANAKLFFQKFQSDYNKENLDLLAGSNLKMKFANTPLSNDFGNYLTKVAVNLMFAAEPGGISATIPSADGKSTTKVELPIFAIPLNERIVAAKLLTASRSENQMWMFTNRAELKDGFMQIVTKILGGQDPSKLNTAALSPAALEWLTENTLVYSTLDNSGP